MQNENLTLLYDLMRRDLHERGLDEQTICTRVGEAMQQRLFTNITPDRLSVGDVANLSQQSLDLIANRMYNKQNSFKETFVQLFRHVGLFLSKIARILFKSTRHVFRWALKLNVEAKLGLLLLIPPFFGIVWYFLNTGIGAYYGDTDVKTMPVTPIYLGLMAIAGAYLVKGNLTTKEEKDKHKYNMNREIN